MSRRRRDDLFAPVSNRPRRVGEEILRLLARPAQLCAEETGMGFITLTAADVSPDLKQARIFVTQMGPTVGQAEVLAALNERAPAMRTLLAKTMTMRSVPRIIFYYDESIARAARLEALLDEVAAGHPPEDDPASSGDEEV
ncbi:MAG TPA: 30S ribosome-binding factor RbfA [Gammaproteobacteria bacterium]|nr:30S ribosome-binding factor RbfA [Gammaproteobacteria bacterium]